MTRSVLATLSACLCAAAAVLWMTARPESSRGARGVSGCVGLDTTSEDVSLAAPRKRLAAPPSEIRATRVEREPVHETLTPAVESVRERRVRVLGRVQRGGESVAGFALAVHFADLPRDEVDWDFTDESGSFEVELAPGSYVLQDDESRCVRRFDVAATDEDLVLEIALPGSS